MANLCQSAEPVEATGPQEGAVSEPVTYSDSAEAQEAAQQTNATLADPAKHKVRRGVNDDCAPQPDGYGPRPTPDTVPAFLAYPPFTVCSALMLPSWKFSHDCSPQRKMLPLRTGILETLSI